MKKYIIICVFLVTALISSAVSADDLSDIISSGVLKLGTMQDYIPFVFTGDDDELDGMDIALVKEIGRRMGVEVQVVSMAFDGLIDALELGQIDIIGGAFAKTDERAERIDFSRIYYNADSEFIGLSSLAKPETVTLDSFRGLKIGVQKGTSFDQWVKTNLVSAGYLDAKNVFTFSDAADEISALDRRDVDLIVLSQDIYEDLMQSSGNYQIFYDGFMKESYAYGMRKNSTLTPVVNQQLTAMLKDGTAQTISDRYFAMDFDAAEINRSRSSSIPTPTPNIPVIIPTPAPAACKNGMTFVQDVTIPDGSQITGGAGFQKTWRVQNTGTCTWDQTFILMYVSGDQMSGQNVYVPAVVAPGQVVDLSVNLIAPNANGTYKGYWQMRSPQGQNFGQTIWVKISVNDGPGDGPVINSFYVNPDSGYVWDSTTAYWSVVNANSIDIFVDGNFVQTSYDANGSLSVSFPDQSEGTHTVSITAHGTSDVSASASYDAYQGQVMTTPFITSFYIDPDSGYVWGSTTASWSVVNANYVEIYADGNLVQTSYDADGSASVSFPNQSEGNHPVTLVAYSASDSTSSTVYYQAYQGQTGFDPGEEHGTGFGPVPEEHATGFGPTN